MEDLESLVGVKRTKGGSNDTEPAYVLGRRTCMRYVGCVALALIVAVLAVWRSDSLLKSISPKLARRRAAYRLAQHSAHSRFTKLGQELEQHLEMDMHEREVALKLRARLRTLERTHRANVTKALDTAAFATEAFTFEAKAALQPYLEGAVDALFAELRSVLEQRIVAPMLSNGGAASDRHRQVHEEILGELRRDAAEREEFVRRSHNAPGDVDGDGFVEDHDADGDGGDRWVDEPEDGEAAAKRDEDWRGELIAHFVEAFERHFNDTAAAEDSQPRALLTTSDAAYAGLVDIGDRLGFPNDLDASTNATAAQLTWQEAEAKLAALEPLLKSARCHAFVPSDPPADDEYDYMQLHNVEHYVSEMRWHAQLNDARNGIETALKDFGKNELTSMALVEKLESLEGEKVFPSFWLFHSPGHWDDYRYGDW